MQNVVSCADLKKTVKFVLLLVSSLVLMACGGGGSTGGPQNGGPTQGSPVPGNNPGNTGSAANMAGNWLMNCQSTFTVSLTVDTTNIVANTLIYTDVGCPAGSEGYTDQYESTYTTGQQITSDDGTPATEIDETLLSIKRTLHTDVNVQAYNASTICGYSDWQKDVAKDITGLDCGVFANSCTSNSASTVCDAAGKTTYTIYAVDDTGTQLMFGSPTTGKDGSTAQTRMTTLLTIFPFIKQ